MTQKRKNSTTAKLLSLAASLMIAVFFSSAAFTASAAAGSETTTLRIISTGDLHGQLTTTNYDNAGEHTGSLAQAHTLIKEAQKEIKAGASITVDVGDTIYGYGTDYVRASNGTEYMYEAMKKVGYDAITLGNHDFDYGYDYVKKQLKSAGLSDVCVLSNVYSVETGKTAWNENKIITKKMKTSAGRTVSVKIGIIGVTLPSLSSYYVHTGILTATDMVQSTQEQVGKLKEAGADVIVVLAHGTMGDEVTLEDDEVEDSVATQGIYSISKIEGVDAIMFGHPHVNFPSSDNNVSLYYEMSGVSTKTGLVNKIPVVSVKDHGAAIGIADLKLTVSSSGEISVKSSQASISYVDSSTPSSSAVTKFKSLYESEIKKTYKDIVGSIENAASVTNYFGMISDNKALQLVNEAKIQLGLAYTHTDYSEYSSYPVIAASNYKKYGKESFSDYINMSDSITIGDILSIQSYNHEYASLYWITGRQLREWLEYCASAYEKTGTSESWPDATINDYVENERLSPVLMPEWTNDWSNFSIFDGIEYTVDTSLPARYDIYGNVSNYGYSRISSLTANGVPVTDDMKMVLVCDVITASKPVIGLELSAQRIKKTSIHSSSLLRDYISEQMEFGAIPSSADNNWHVNFPTGGDYLVRSSSVSLSEAQEQPWYVANLKNTENYAYYQASFTEGSFQDTNGPTLVLASTIEVETNKSVPVIVQANDASGVASCKYVEGYHDAADPIWDANGTAITDPGFLVSSNGTYSVMATDLLGNKTVKHITVSNINTNVLQVPTVDKYTNRKSAITGIGEPNATVHFSSKTGTYETVVDSTGAFSYALPPQEADSIIKVHLSDSQGRKSATVDVTVGRTGPNYPEVNELTNKSDKITGDLKDTTSQIFVISGSKVYVAKDGGEAAYKASSHYNPAKTIVPTRFVTYGTEFVMDIPVQTAETSLKIYAVDKIGRTNQQIQRKVEEVAPNQPVIYTACDAENHVFGYVPNPLGTYDITVTIDGSAYTGTTDSEGRFTIETDNLEKDSVIAATASDMVDNKTRTSAEGTRTVASYEKYLEENKSQSEISLSPMTNKDTVISGEILPGPVEALYLKVDGKCYTLQTAFDGTFSIELEKGLEPGSVIQVVYRNQYSNIIEAAAQTVTLALPENPQLRTETIYNTTTSVSVFCVDLCKAVVKIDGKVYESSDGSYDEELGGYLYKVKIEKPSAGSTAYIYMENASGTSEKIKTDVVAKAPEILDLSDITADDKKITGSLLLVLPEDSEDIPTVENTETIVYAKVKGKVYEGIVKDDGTFKIVFDSKWAKGTKIVVWASNAYGGNSQKITLTVAAGKETKK